jgi:hypothetical protein
LQSNPALCDVLQRLPPAFIAGALLQYRRLRAMRLYLINPSNPLVSMARVKENRWNRYRVWKPLSLMVLAGLTPPEWEVSILDENLGVPDYDALPPDWWASAFTSQANRACRCHPLSRAGCTCGHGGIHATCLDEVRRAWTLVTGEAEGVWAQLLADAQRGAGAL